MPGLGGGAPAVLPTQLGQVPAVTQAVVPVTQADGQIRNVPVMYTQTFASVPSQGAAPAQGSVGLGSLTGAVGAVKTEQAKKSNEAATGRRSHVAIALLMGGIGFIGGWVWL